MPRRELVGDGFGARRRNEELAFLVVKFLRAYLAFQDIRGAFREASAASRLAGSGLFEKVRDLEESLAFDLKEKAHRLFRSSPRQGNGGPPATPAELRRAIEARSIDSYIGTGFHLLLILREALYQIDAYTPELEKEKEELARIVETARTGRARLSPEAASEIEQLRVLDESSVMIREEAETLAARMVERCSELFRQSAAALRRFMKSRGDNEILLLNLLQNRDLLEKVYGEGAAESIFAEMCRSRRFTGATGTEKAENYVRVRCGNVTGLRAQEKPSRSA